MSRIGNRHLVIPEGVTVTVNGNNVAVKGPKGELSMVVSNLIKVEVSDGKVLTTRPNDEKTTKQLHGTTRALIQNMITGVHEGYAKTLLIEGIGFRAAIKGTTLTLNIGYSHEINYEVEEGVTVQCTDPTTIVVSGIDKQRVGEVAAEIRAYRKPEPYKGKGIRYNDEHILRKEGKVAA